MRIFGYEINKSIGYAGTAVYVRPDGRPVRVADLAPDEARCALDEIVGALRVGFVARIDQKDKFGRITYRRIDL